MLLIHPPRQPTSDRRLTNRKQRKGLTQKWPLGTEVVQLSSSSLNWPFCKGASGNLKPEVGTQNKQVVVKQVTQQGVSWM